MNLLLVSIDSLRRDFLGAYADRPRVLDYEVSTPNLDRFADRAAVFETHYAGSLFCMPTRREWLAGVQEFPWRGWGPIEPFDTTLPEAVRAEGTFTGLVTDHYHYFQHGADGYYEDYNAFEFVRGHEFDAWREAPRDPDPTLLAQIDAEANQGVDFLDRTQYARNAAGFKDKSDFFAPRVFSRAAEFLETVEWDDWFLYVDSFDVHQPFHVPEPYASMYTDESPRDPDLPIWPRWGQINAGQGTLTERELAFVRSQFAANVTMVDNWFGRLVNVLDERGLWQDTVVVVTSDHGYSLGDHGYVGKIHMPMYDVLARTPLMIYHPDGHDERVRELTAAVDLHPTMLDVCGATEAGDHPHGWSLLDLLTGDPSTPHRDWAIYGEWGSGVSVTDGRYTYHHPCGADRAEYYSTTMANPRGVFLPTEGRTDAEAGAFLPYTDVPVWQYSGEPVQRHEEPLLFDTQTDPAQEHDRSGIEEDETARLRTLLSDALNELRVPDSVCDRLGVER